MTRAGIAPPPRTEHPPTPLHTNNTQTWTSETITNLHDKLFTKTN
jgi:hypothetical protein